MVTMRWPSNRPREIAAALLLAAVGTGCTGRAPRDATVAGPESDDLLKAVEGQVLIADAGTRIRVVSLPTLNESTVPMAAAADEAEYPIIHALSGPDVEGRIAYIEDWFFVRDERTRRHLLKTVPIDGGADTKIFTRPESAMWAATPAGRGGIGTHVGFAPSGGRAAFVSGLAPVQMENPSAYLHVGYLEVWNVTTKEGGGSGIKVLDDRLAWFPDGERLAYVELIDRSRMSESFPSLTASGSGFDQWESIPVVHVLNVETGDREPLHIGWQPVVSCDGGSVLVSDFEGTWSRVDMATRESKRVDLPGSAGNGAFACLNNDLVLYWAFPTRGTTAKYTRNNSPLVGPKLMLSLKITELSSGSFQTIVPDVDPRTKVSFTGRVDR